MSSKTNFFKRFIESLKRKKQEEYRKKCSVIFNHTKQYYYDNFVNQESVFTTTEKPVDFSWIAFEAYRNNYAYKQATKQLKIIIAEKRINDTFKALVKYTMKTVEI